MPIAKKKTKKTVKKSPKRQYKKRVEYQEGYREYPGFDKVPTGGMLMKEQMAYDDPIDRQFAEEQATFFREHGAKATVVKYGNGYNILVRGKYVNMSP